MPDKLDLLIDVAISGAEIETGIPISLVISRSPGLAPKLANGGSHAKHSRTPPWTEQEDDFLRQQLGFISEEEIAARLGRSLIGTHLRWKRDLRLPAPSKDPRYLTAHKIALLLGVDSHIPPFWVDSGILPGEMLPGMLKEHGRNIRRVKKTTFLRWVVNPKSWIWFDLEKIVDPHLKKLVHLKQERWGDEWWDTPRVAAYHGVDTKDVTRFIKMGRIRAVKAFNRGARYPNSKWSYWYILKSEATRPDLVFEHGKGAGHRLYWNPGFDRFCILSYAVGISSNAIGRMAKIGRQSYWRLADLWRRGELIEIIKSNSLPVAARVCSPNPAIFADWRDCRAHFPALARAMDRFGRGQRLSWKEIYLVRGVLSRWLGWNGISCRCMIMRNWSKEKAQTRLYEMLKVLQERGIDPCR